METTQNKLKVYNLIILDKSGSMDSIRSATVSGVNEIIQSIRKAQQQFADTQEHYFTLRLFCGCEQRDVYDACPIGLVQDLSQDQYQPCCMTPLLDAIGFSLQKMERMTEGQECTVVVTVVTDGLENASRHFSGIEVSHMITRLSERGWTFAYQGSDHDVASVCANLGIHNVSSFEHTNEGTGASFDYESKSRMRHYRRISEMRSAEPNLCYEEQVQRIRTMNQTFYEPQSVPVREIFVFGSNAQGIHNGGAAQKALLRYGAVMGQAEGLQGDSYAIPTVGVTPDVIVEAVSRFCQFAKAHPEMRFKVTAIGCGHAGFTPGQVAPLFASVWNMPNVELPREFVKVLRHARH